jgi:threonylcarbamoyladenosine tRNA methylthiotransferase MtaB
MAMTERFDPRPDSEPTVNGASLCHPALDKKDGQITGINPLERPIDGPQVVSMGCRLNTAESDAMQTWAKAQNLDNAIIVNTCAVTTEAERQARQTIRRLRKDNPNAYIIATGCAVQMRPQAFAEMPEIDRVLGNGAKTDPENFGKTMPHRVVMTAMPAQLDNQLPLTPLLGRSKVFVQIQNGCDHNCSYCTITIARGRSRSVPFDQILRYVRHALDEGVQEVILTGVDLTSYDLDGLRLGQVVQGLLDGAPDLQRLRISSMDSIEICPQLFELLAYEPRVLPHIHLSLQSGNDAILASMKRRHTAKQAVDLCGRLKQARPEMALGADFIAGFPGESDAMFEDTMTHVLDCQLTHLHVFPFSGRPGTLAAILPNQVPAETIKRRAIKLRNLGQSQLNAWLNRHVGNGISVLAENPHFGHSDDFCPVRFEKPVAANTIVCAHIEKVVDGSLMATRASQPLCKTPVSDVREQAPDPKGPTPFDASLSKGMPQGAQPCP